MNIKIPVKENKTRIVSLRMTETDHELFIKVAKELNTSIATLLIEIAKTRLAVEAELAELKESK